MLKAIIYTLVQFTWGFPQSLLGLIVWYFVAGSRRFRYRCANVSAWKYSRGLSLGPYIFVPEGLGEKPERELIVHEYGHTIQSLIFGPFYLPFFVLPSLIWAGVPALSRRRHARSVSYYSLYTERLANWLGERVSGDESPGQRLVD